MRSRLAVASALATLAVAAPALASGNDLCTDAIPVICGSTTGGSTTTGNLDVLPDCGTSITAPGVWYTITGTGDDITVDTIGSSFDTKLSVFEDGCGTLTCIDGNDDLAFGVLQSEVTWSSVNGVTYHILVHGFANATGDFDLNVTCAAPPVAPANDDCANAESIACGDTVMGNTDMAATDGAPFCDFSNTAPGVWYSLVGDGRNVLVSTAGSTYDTKLSIYTGGCVALNCVRGDDDDGPGLTSQIGIFTAPGVTYYILVHGFGSATGDYTLSVECFAPLPNDICDDAESIACGATVVGDTTGASPDGAPFCDTSNTSRGIWYRLTGTGGVITATTCNAGTSYDTKLSVYADGCGTLTCVIGNDDDIGNSPSLCSTVSWSSEAGREYLLLVHGFGQDAGEFELTVSCADICIYDNGAAGDPVSGQSSERGTVVDLSSTADDFTLKHGFMHRVDSITVQMITSSDLSGSWTEPCVELTLFDDCDGCPNNEIDCGFFKATGTTDIEIAGVQPANLPAGFQLVDVTFNTGTRIDPDTGETIPGLWLPGGTYWLSPVGLGDGTFQDSWLWAAAGADSDPLIGAIAKTVAGDYKILGWTPVSETNVGCRNFAFTIGGISCCILLDNGEPDLSSNAVAAGVNTTTPGHRNADNFALMTCDTNVHLCYLDAYILTNCDPCRTKLEIHDDACCEVGPLRESERLVSKCTTFPEQTFLHNNQLLTLHRVEWHDLAIPLDASRNYWASIHVQGTGAFNEIGFVAFNAPCDRACDISICPAQALTNPASGGNNRGGGGEPTNGGGGSVAWDLLTADLAIRAAFLAIELSNATPGDDPGPASDNCAGDFDGNGTADVTDLLGFLNVWFEGCD